MSFNPRSREGSDKRGEHMEIRARPVSIHAPAKGATGRSGSCRPYPGRFNPRSREGSDMQDRFANMPQISFNPRSREGSDGKELVYERGQFLIIGAALP